METQTVPEAKTRAAKEPSVIQSAFSMSLGTMASRVLGLVRDILVTSLFSRTVSDAFVVAFRLPNLFRRLLGEGSLAVSFIPLYVTFLNRPGSPEEQSQRAQALSSAIFSILTAVTASLSVLGTLLMPEILSWVVSGKGFTSIPGKFELTVFLARIMFVYLFLVMTYAFFMGLMNAAHRFFLPAVAPAFFNLVVIVFALLPQDWGRVPGEFLAWGVVVGGAVQVLIVLWPLVQMRSLPRLTWRWRKEGVRQVLVNMVPGLVGTGVLQLMTLVNVSLASRLPEGAHSYIYLADRLLELPQSLLAVSMGAALLPTLAAHFGRGEVNLMRETGQRTMRLLLFLAVPCAWGLWVLAEPIVQVLFMRGTFTAADVVPTAQVIQVYAVVLVIASLHRVVVPNFYAVGNTSLPALAAVITVAVHVFVANIWVDQFGLPGLNWATALSALVNLAIVLGAYRIRFGSTGFLGLFLSFLHTLLPSALMGVVVAQVYRLSLGLLPAGEGVLPWSRAAALAVAVATGVAVYFLGSRLVLHPEVDPVLRLLQRKWRRSPKGGNR